MDYTKNKLTRAAFGPLRRPLPSRRSSRTSPRSWEVNAGRDAVHVPPAPGREVPQRAPVNGREFTSDDVKASFERYRPAACRRTSGRVVDRFEIPDEYTVDLQAQPAAGRLPAQHRRLVAHGRAGDHRRHRASSRARRSAPGPSSSRSGRRRSARSSSRNPDYFEKGLPFLDQRDHRRAGRHRGACAPGFSTDNWFDWGAATTSKTPRTC